LDFIIANLTNKDDYTPGQPKEPIIYFCVMLLIAYPTPEFKIKSEKGKEYIFDGIRKKWLFLTPEEWVRQNFIQYLIRVMNYPATLIALEKEIQLGELKKRFDILVYDQNHQPWMMVECKSMDVPLTEETVHQILRYNLTIPVRYLVITNGSYCIGWERISNGVEELQELPILKT
jgi:hypothetical protein